MTEAGAGTAAAAEAAAQSARGDMDAAIATLRQCIAASRRVVAEPAVKHWLGRRWRHLFVREAVKDPVALEAASRPGDRRPEIQRIAERYLHQNAEAAWRDEQPEARIEPARETAFLICPGLVNGLLPKRDFQDELYVLEQRFGMRTLRADSHPIRGCEANVADIMLALNLGKGRDAPGRLIPETAARPPASAVVLGYSKGAPDFLTTLVRHPEIRHSVRCFFSWAGAIGGSEVADDLARKFKATRFERQAADLGFRLKGFAHTRMSRSPDARRRRVGEADTVAAVRDLTTAVRQKFLADHAGTLDALDLPIFTIRGVTRLREVPFSQRGGYRLLSRIEPQNDMQVVASRSQLAIPMATELAALHGHHWDIAHPSFRDRRWLNNTYHPFPRAAALTAMVLLAAELGLAG